MGKNNFDEKIKQEGMQAKRERFSIRKLSIGTTSVLLGLTFVGVNSQTAKAATTQPQSQANKVAAKTSKKAATSKKTDLSTYEGLSSFLTSSQSSASKTNKAKASGNDSTSTTSSTAEEAATSTQEQISAANQDTGTSVPSSQPASSGKSGDDVSSAPTTEDITDSGVTEVEPQGDPVSTRGYNGASTPTSDHRGFDTTTDAKVHIGNWNDYTNALKNTNVHEIDLINNIASDRPTGRPDLNFQQHRVVIQSDPDLNQRFVLDLHTSSPRPDGGVNGTSDVTYKNLKLYSQSYYGLLNTHDGNMKFPNKVTLEDIDFIGSQVIFSGIDTDIYIKGTVNAAAVNSYRSPLDGQTYSCDGGGQQLFELWRPGCNLTFTKDCKFVGSTSDGNVIELSNGDNGTTNGRTNRNNVVIESGADVTLNPRANDGSNSDAAQHTSKASGITIFNGVGGVTVNKNAHLTINVGTSDYTGGLDKRRAAAITLTSSYGNGNSAQLIDNGTITINTNGDISSSAGGSSKSGVLVYDQGDLRIGPGGSLNVYGKNMQNYTGTLIYITGKASLNGGTLDIELQNDENHPGNKAYGAGTNVINLVDVASADALKVNNPRKLVLNASLNTTPGTSIIGDNEIDITNVRQQFDFSSLFPGTPVITLPPFHILKVKKSDGSIDVLPNGIEVLNGKQSLQQATVNNVAGDLAGNASLTAILAKAFGVTPAQVPATLQALVDQKVPFDQIFAGVIHQAFSHPDSPGYNNITMIPTNQGGFLDIQDNDGIPGQASWHQDMSDGSVTITGKVLNHIESTDGPTQPDNLFSKIMQCGTEAYVIARINSNTAVYTDPQNPVISPYTDTNNLNSDLPMTLTAKADQDGNFSFKIPMGTPGLASGATIHLTPEANFIGFDPEIANKDAVVQIGTIANVTQIKTQAERDLDAGLIKADGRIKASGLSSDDQQEYLTRVQSAHDNAIYYIDRATTFDQVDMYKGRAIDTYNQEAAKSEFKAFANDCAAKIVIPVSDTDTVNAIADAITFGNGVIETSIGSSHVEDKTENTLTNQRRDGSERNLLGKYQSWSNAQLDTLAGEVKNKIGQETDLGQAKITELQAQVDAMLMGLKDDVINAVDPNKLKAALDNGRAKLNSFPTSESSDALRAKATAQLQTKWFDALGKLDEATGIFPKLTTSERYALIDQVNMAVVQGSQSIQSCPANDITNQYNNVISNIDNILADAANKNSAHA